MPDAATTRLPASASAEAVVPLTSPSSDRSPRWAMATGPVTRPCELRGQGERGLRRRPASG